MDKLTLEEFNNYCSLDDDKRLKTAMELFNYEIIDHILTNELKLTDQNKIRKEMQKNMPYNFANSYRALCDYLSRCIIDSDLERWCNLAIHYNLKLTSPILMGIISQNDYNLLVKCNLKRMCKNISDNVFQEIIVNSISFNETDQRILILLFDECYKYNSKKTLKKWNYL